MADDIPDPQVYRRAAEQIANGVNHYSCFAIQREAGYCDLDDSEYVRQYSLMFRPRTAKDRARHPFWDRGPNSSCLELERECRILALLFMADICEQGG